MSVGLGLEQRTTGGSFTTWRTEQGRRDSNPRPTVLETAALPTELRPWVRQDCSRALAAILLRMRGRQRSPLGALFSLLALGLAGVAFAAAYGAGGQAGRWVVAVAAA